MKPREFLQVDPASLHLPGSRRDGADMRSMDQTRGDLLAALSELSQLRPEWRFGQTVANLATTAGRLEPGGVWDLEDEEALTAARTLIEQYSELELEASEPIATPGGSRPAGSSQQDGVTSR
jgi:hypothetical protein